MVLTKVGFDWPSPSSGKGIEVFDWLKEERIITI